MRSLDLLLQWGRVLADAETWTQPIAVRKSGGLQWGRVLADAETLGEMQVRHYVIELQWGRVLADAETGLHRHHQLLLSAASMKPRPRGRGDEGAEELDVLLLDASMGPRPRGRGDASTFA